MIYKKLNRTPVKSLPLFKFHNCLNHRSPFHLISQTDFSRLLIEHRTGTFINFYKGIYNERTHLQNIYKSL